MFARAAEGTLICHSFNKSVAGANVRNRSAVNEKKGRAAEGSGEEKGWMRERKRAEGGRLDPWCRKRAEKGEDYGDKEEDFSSGADQVPLEACGQYAVNGTYHIPLQAFSVYA